MSTVLDSAPPTNGHPQGNGSPAVGLRPNVVIHSQAMREVFRLVGRVAKSNASVLIQGESGTGKELVAHEIHAQSERRGPFVSINCAAIPSDLLESSLFGHVRGSFTGAYRDATGLMRAAQFGTFFLDEVSGMPLATQVKLLRALQEREVLPVGGVRPFPINCRVLAATNINLGHSIAAGDFRADLLYRLNVIDLTLPPLRERTEDIALLIAYFIKKHTLGEVPPVTPEARALLMQYPWPGNIRQLENAIERAVVLDDDGQIGIDDLPRQVVLGSLDQPPPVTPFQPLSLGELERQHILAVLQFTNGNKTQAATILGITRQGLRNRLAQYGLVTIQHRPPPGN